MNKVEKIQNYDDIYKLRLNSLAKSDFKISPQSLAIDQKDHEGVHLGIYHQGELVSALRLYEVENAEQLERQLDYKNAAQLNLTYPVRVIGKANTHPEFKSQGLMKKIVADVLQNYHEKPLIFTTKPSNPLNSYFEERGFLKVNNPEGWHRFGYHSGGETVVYYK
jgi:predicted GNAT family N-acyltransferase